MVSKISLNSLFQIAIGGGIALYATGYYLQQKIVNRIQETEYYKTALQELKNHKGACQLLGEPIRDQEWNIKKKSNECDGVKATMQIPISGSKKSGTYYFWADRIDEQWKVTKAELEFKNDPNRRLVIVKEVATEQTAVL